VAPTFGVLLGAITLMGLTTVAGQIAIPMAGDLADDASRGRPAQDGRAVTPGRATERRTRDDAGTVLITWRWLVPVPVLVRRT
jgi:hypothetical protein